MKPIEKPMLFSAAMVRALLDGSKTQTRRVMNPQPDFVFALNGVSIRCIHTSDETINWRDIENDSGVTERRLYGGQRWQDLLSDSLCWFWSEGIRGMVCVNGVQKQQKVFDCFVVPPEQKENTHGSPPCVYGFSWDASTIKTASEAFGWEPRQQQARQSEMGDSIRTVGRRAETWNIPRGIKAFQVKRKTSQGDHLYVKETFQQLGDKALIYRADCLHPENYAWKPSIFMPRWASRITLEVTAVRVEHLNDISEEDAKMEGCNSENYGCYPFAATVMPTTRWATRNYCRLWESIHGKNSWSLNPQCWCYTFKRVKP